MKPKRKKAIGQETSVEPLSNPQSNIQNQPALPLNPRPANPVNPVN
jgi:hypothetical protein